MKKSITLFLGLLLLGAGTKSYGQAAGDYVFTQATDNLWATTTNWSTSDGAGNLTAATRIPNATDNVWIQTGRSLDTTPASVTVTGSTVTSGSATLVLSAESTSILPGMAVRAKENAAITYGIAPGTYVVSVSGTTVTLSKPAISTTKGDFTFIPACKSLNVAGTFKNSAAFVVMGNITVDASATLTMNSDLYCSNILNKGTFNSTTSARSSKNLYTGFEGAVPGTGDYTLINDGVFGHTVPVIPVVNGSGIFVLYSNQANKYTIKSSSPSITGAAFNIAAVLPHNNNKTTANTTLEIKQTMSLLRHNGIGLSVQNNDSSLTTNRICTIDPGVTVYVGYRFHTNGGVTLNPQGNVTYNVYGTLDLATYTSFAGNTTPAAANTSDFSLCMSSVAGNTGSLIFNLGDGTQANAGTLILGSNMKMIKQRTQTLALNFKDYSTVKFKGNYGWMMNYVLLNSNTPAPYLTPSKFYNLAVDSAKFVLPVKPIVRGTYTAPTGRAATSNWVAPTLATKMSTSLYYGTTATNAPQGSIVYTGSAYYYVPVVRAVSSYTASSNPITISGDTTLNYIQAGDTITGGSGIAAKVTSLTANSLLMTSAVASGTTAQSNITLSFIGMQGTVAPTGTTSPVFDGTQALIYLGSSDFATPTLAPNAVNSPNANSVLVYSAENNKLVIAKATVGDIATVFSISGVKVATVKLTSDNTTLSIARGIYLVKVNNSVSKVVVK